jgi:hypothetical protein
MPDVALAPSFQVRDVGAMDDGMVIAVNYFYKS